MHVVGHIDRVKVKTQRAVRINLAKIWEREFRGKQFGVEDRSVYIIPPTLLLNEIYSGVHLV